MNIDSLGAFLKSRRDRVTPDAVGLRPFGTSRRVPGLRREELAQLAGMSVGYYTRLEQDHRGTASDQVLDALARVLRLSDAEATHLRNLSRHPAEPRLRRPEPETPDARVMTLLHSLHDSLPAVVLGRRGDVLAWNRAGHALMAGHLSFQAPFEEETRPSIPHMFFLDERHRNLYRNWEELAHTHAGYLRLTAGRYPTDARLAELIGGLAMRSPDFTSLWATGDVADCTAGPMRLRHPEIGDVDLEYQVWLQPDCPDHRLEVYTPGDPASSDALKLLDSV
ncbi:helix-turn-helix transcriptional regulator [Salininema proteolyticum]|uniref:Helix-turn-helix transcriptional regulator n=1 Tax=Salininema proteolyticum TaxID=1607685 RepID=A0ABV8U349_9ACTN